MDAPLFQPLRPEESDKPATEERIPITKRTWFICLKVVTLCVLSICGVFSITFVPGFYVSKALISENKDSLEKVWDYHRFTFLVVS